MSSPLLPGEAAAGAYPISAVERETGLSKDTLRMWERRYGFPAPGRDAQGERVYPAEQVSRLRQLRRLIHAGHRPGQVVALAPQALQALIQAVSSGGADGDGTVPVRARKARRGGLRAQADAQAPGQDALAPYLECIAAHDPVGLRDRLTRAMLSLGLERCVLECVAPLNRAVGLAWVEGRFEVFEEHLYTECVTGVLRSAVAGVPAAPTGRTPRVLLTTFAQEQHGLGILMLEVLLALRGCTCLPLGTQTPHADIARAAEAFRADIVALSFSGVLPPAQVRAGLQEMRAQLPTQIAVWAGGQGAAGLMEAVAGVQVLRELEDMPPALALWRAERSLG
jgi:methylmalonyl-CoA mutase cobalamin-binding subunit/transposase-like protein